MSASTGLQYFFISDFWIKYCRCDHCWHSLQGCSAQRNSVASVCYPDTERWSPAPFEQPFICIPSTCLPVYTLTTFSIIFFQVVLAEFSWCLDQVEIIGNKNIRLRSAWAQFCISYFKPNLVECQCINHFFICCRTSCSVFFIQACFLQAAPPHGLLSYSKLQIISVGWLPTNHLVFVSWYHTFPNGHTHSLCSPHTNTHTHMHPPFKDV